MITLGTLSIFKALHKYYQYILLPPHIVIPTLQMRQRGQRDSLVPWDQADYEQHCWDRDSRICL